MKILSLLACTALIITTTGETFPSGTATQRLSKFISAGIATTGLIGAVTELLKGPFAKRCISLSSRTKKSGIPLNHLLGLMTLLGIYAHGITSKRYDGDEESVRRMALAATTGAIIGLFTAQFWNYGIRDF